MKLSGFKLYAFTGFFLALGLATSEATAEDRKFDAQLIWGTDKQKSDDPKLKPVHPDLVKGLQDVFRWKFYYQVTNVTFVVQPNGPKRVALSDKCEIVVRDLGKTMTEVQLYGEKKLVKKITQAVAQCLVIGSEDRQDTDAAWFVVLTPK